MVLLAKIVDSQKSLTIFTKPSIQGFGREKDENRADLISIAFSFESGCLWCYILEHVYMKPEVNLTGLRSRSVYMAISLRATLKSQTTFKNCSVYMEISLWQLSRPLQDSIAHVQMISFNKCKLNWCKTDVTVLVVTFTSPEVMWTLIMKLPYREVKFYPEVKFQTGLSSLRVSCKRVPSYQNGGKILSIEKPSIGRRWLRN